MASVITMAFEGWKAQEAASGKPVLLNEFVFANVPNLDPTKPIDRNEKLPPANQIVCRQAVNKAGLASENAVAYSVTLGADVGDFDFNWIGLLNKESGTVAMITHAPLQKKLKTQNGQQGNVLIRSFLLEFQGAAVETQIKTSAETWQIDFTARLSGIDEMQRLINVDSYGAAAFFDESFEVTRSGEQFTVKKGLGYVGGLRGELAQNQILNNLRNTKVYADFSYQGNIVSQWNTVVKITAAATLNNYVDAAGFTHQVFAIASIDANGNVKDLRPMGGLSSQEIAALETRFKLDLSKKIDKANITHQTGNSTELVVSQQLLTTEMGKKQPAGNYQPTGDYATNAALNNGLGLKFDKTGGSVDGNVTAVSLGVVRKSTNSTIYLYPAPDAQQNGYAYFQYKIGDYWYGRVEIPRAESNQTTRLMQVGDYGIGISLPQSSTNFTSTTLGTGFYAMPGGTGNPWGNNGSAHIVNVRDGNYGFQIGRTTGNMNLSFRTLTAGAFSTISTLYSTANTVIDRNGCVKRTSYPDELSDYPVGAPIPWSQATAPSGYLICNGQWFNKTAYPLLTKAYPSGQLPDLRGEFIRGLDAGRNIDSGRAVLSAQSDDNKEHTHSIVLKNGNGNGSNDQASIRTLAVNVGNATYTTEKSGGKESRPRNIAFLYIVRAA